MTITDCGCTMDGQPVALGGPCPAGHHLLCRECLTDGECPWCGWTPATLAQCGSDDPDECAMMRERLVAGTAEPIPDCPVHGAFPADSGEREVAP